MQFFLDHYPYLWRRKVPNLFFGPRLWTGLARLARLIVSVALSLYTCLLVSIS